MEVRSRLSYCPRSSLPAKVLTYLASRLAHLLPPRPPGQGGTPPLSLEVRLDAAAAVILDGLSYRRAGRAVGISKTEVGDRLGVESGQQGEGPRRAGQRCRQPLACVVVVQLDPPPGCAERPPSPVAIGDQIQVAHVRVGSKQQLHPDRLVSVGTQRVEQVVIPEICGTPAGSTCTARLAGGSDDHLSGSHLENTSRTCTIVGGMPTRQRSPVCRTGR